MKKILIIVALSIASSARAGQVVDQGQPGPEWNFNNAARQAGKTSQVCMTNAAGGTTITSFSRRKAIELQNLGPNQIYCTVDGTAPLADGTNGRRIEAATATTTDKWSLDVGPGITIRCIAATAAQVSGACTMVSELR